MKKAQWKIQNCTFYSDISFLPLPCYGMVVRMDWLQALSPMRVDWDHKWLAIHYKGATVVLQGLPRIVPSYTMVELWLLNSPGQSAPQAPIHPQIPSLLQQFAILFEDLKGLPPSRDYDHTIPLVQGAQPVSVRA